jgi:hypothetical protein
MREIPMPLRTRMPRRPPPALALAILLLAGCALPREPAQEPMIGEALAELATDTFALLGALEPDQSGPFAERAPRYRALLARARTVRLMAEARGGPAAQETEGAGALGRAVAGLAARVLPDEAPDPGAVGRLMTEYRDATPAYMADYARLLRRLRERDRATTADRLGRIEAHEAAMAEHETRVAAYLDAWRRYRAGRGPRPEPPGPPPDGPALALDADRLALARTALEDVLRDALVYERLLLDRTR